MSDQPESAPSAPAASQGSTAKVKEGAKKAYAEGQARRLVITKGDRTYYDVSLLITIVLAIFAPWVAIAALVLAVVAGCKIEFTGPDSNEGDATSGDDATLAT